MNDPIPAIREDAATGETATLFADIRATLGVPFVNLIWRYIATRPDMLAWTWSVVKPLHARSALHEAAQELRTGVAVPSGIRQPAAVFDAAGVGPEHRQVIRAMLHDYNAANAVNLLSLMLVQALLSGEAPGGQVAEDARSRAGTGTASRALPPLPGLSALPASHRALVLALDQFGRSEPTDAVASLYRHLAHWPGFLAIAHAALSLPQQEGSLRAEHERTRTRATALMRRHLLPGAEVQVLPPTDGQAEARAAIRIFTGQMIGRMVAMGEIMLALLPAEADEAGPSPPAPSA